MTPTIGHIVHYRLAEADVARIDAQRRAGLGLGHFGPHGSQVEPGQVVPLIVVKVWDGDPEDVMVNGQAFLDGTDTLWVMSAHEGDDPGTWAWPPRV